MKVYKIIKTGKIQNMDDYEIGKSLPVIEYDRDSISAEKKRLESIFEDVRRNEFPNDPSRQENAFFVFLGPIEEKSWLVQMSKNESMDYILVTLEVNGDDVSWYNVDYLDDSSNKDETVIHQNAKNYWQSRTSSPTSNEKKLYEGLVTGDNTIVNVQEKHWDYKNRTMTVK